MDKRRDRPVQFQVIPFTLGPCPEHEFEQLEVLPQVLVAPGYVDVQLTRPVENASCQFQVIASQQISRRPLWTCIRQDGANRPIGEDGCFYQLLVEAKFDGATLHDFLTRLCMKDIAPFEDRTISKEPLANHSRCNGGINRGERGGIGQHLSQTANHHVIQAISNIFFQCLGPECLRVPNLLSKQSYQLPCSPLPVGISFIHKINAEGGWRATQPGRDQLSGEHVMNPPVLAGVVALSPRQWCHARLPRRALPPDSPPCAALVLSAAHIHGLPRCLPA